MARRADHDPKRDRLRDPAVWNDGKALAQLANNARAEELSPQLLVTLGARLMALGADAEPMLRSAQERFPADFWVNLMLGNALARKGKPEEAEGYFRAAQALRPRTPVVHFGIAYVRILKGHVDEGIAEIKKGIQLDPKYATAHFVFGLVLRQNGHVEEAIAEFKKAIELDPRNAAAHGNLVEILLQQGQFAEAGQAIQRSLELPPANDPVRPKATQLLRRCEQMLALDNKLAAILKGEAKPANGEEQISLARLCYSKKRYADAAHFFADAFTAQPKLAENLQTGDRYDAACDSALAAAGQGEDAGNLDDKERAHLRKQALDWLRADLALWNKQIEKGTPQERAAAKQTLGHWQQDADLAGLRDAAAVDRLPEAERAEYRKLWNDVAALLKK